MGRIELVCGPMFSGKTTELLRRYERSQRAGRRVEFLRPAMDTREPRTHSGTVVPCQYFKDWHELVDVIARSTDPCDPAPLQHLVVDEIQFVAMDSCSRFVDLLQEYMGQRDLIVTLGGLDTDQAGKPFRTTAALAAVAEEVTKLSAVCECGADATRSMWTSELPFNATTRVGGADRYAPKCRMCFQPVEEEHSLRMFPIGHAHP